ncbi:hypothetical protein AGMMS50276_26840 [Synergistales bacterium]|nr:hypothetical protein AGMMS50276_26840 [Synergistales bacterium]
MNESPKVISVQWFFLPPIVGVFTFMAVITFGGGVPTFVHSSIWGLTALLFTVMTILYAIFLSRGFAKGLLPTQVIAQGLLVCPVALQIGASMLEWLGVTMVICGSAILLVFYYHSKHYGEHVFGKANKQSQDSNDIDYLPVPVALTDGEGDIISVSDSFLQITGLSRRDVLSYPVTVLTPIDREIVNIKGKDWKLLQSATSNDKYCFCLEGIADAHRIPQIVGSSDIIDPVTTLSTPSAIASYTAKELYRVNRYKRHMSVALIRISFGDSDLADAQNTVFNSYCKYIGKSIRSSDSASAISKCDIFLLFPETKLEGGGMALSKLVDITSNSELAGEFLKLSTLPKFLDKVFFYGPPANDVTFDNILSRLVSSLGAHSN